MFLAEKRDGAFFACALMLATHFKMGKWDEQHGKSQRSLDPKLIRTLNLLHHSPTSNPLPYFLFTS